MEQDKRSTFLGDSGILLLVVLVVLSMLLLNGMVLLLYSLVTTLETVSSSLPKKVSSIKIRRFIRRQKRLMLIRVVTWQRNLNKHWSISRNLVSKAWFKATFFLAKKT